MRQWRSSAISRGRGGEREAGRGRRAAGSGRGRTAGRLKRSVQCRLLLLVDRAHSLGDCLGPGRSGQRLEERKRRETPVARQVERPGGERDSSGIRAGFERFTASPTASISSRRLEPRCPYVSPTASRATRLAPACSSAWAQRSCLLAAARRGSLGVLRIATTSGVCPLLSRCSAGLVAVRLRGDRLAVGQCRQVASHAPECRLTGFDCVHPPHPLSLPAGRGP